MPRRRWIATLFKHSPPSSTNRVAKGQGQATRRAHAQSAVSFTSDSEQQDRLLVALRLTASVEQIESALPTRRRFNNFLAQGRVARRPELPTPMESFASSVEPKAGDPTDPETRRLRSRTSADLVVLAKFDLRSHLKLRATYAESSRTLAIHPPWTTSAQGITNILRAQKVVEVHAPGLMPGLLAHGHLQGDLPYLVEQWVDGHPLNTREALSDTAPEVLSALRVLYSRFGITSLPVSKFWKPAAQEWVETVKTGIVPSELTSWIDELLERRGTIRQSWMHGDAVSSNIIRTSHGIVLIDWEHSHHGPLMRDAAKLHLFSSTPEKTLAQILESLSGKGALRAPATPSGYSAPEELALCHARLISQYARRSKALISHPRATGYQMQTRGHVKRLAQARQAA